MVFPLVETPSLTLFGFWLVDSGPSMRPRCNVAISAMMIADLTAAVFFFEKIIDP